MRAVHRICARQLPFALWLLVFLASPASPNALGSATILVLYDDLKATHRSIFEHFRAAILHHRERGMPPRITGMASGKLDIASLDSIQPDLIVTIGVSAAARLRQQASTVPQLNVFLPRAAYEQLHNGDSRPPAALFLDQPIERQMALARALRPNARRVGMLRTEEPGNAPTEIDQLAHRFGFDLVVVTIDADGNAARAIKQVVASSDLIIVRFDREAYKPATTKWLLYLAFQQRRPIVGFSSALLDAGAAAVTFSTPEQIAAHAAELVRVWLDNGKAPRGSHYPRYYHVRLNGPVADVLDVAPMDEAELAARMRDALAEPE